MSTWAIRSVEPVPTYEYVCTSCGHQFDAVQSFSDPPLERCEVCGGSLRRVFHPAGILFKGSGFYSTDNRRVGPSGKAKPGERHAKAERSSDGGSGSSSDGSSSDGPSRSSAGSSSGSSSGGKKAAEQSA